MPLNAKGKKLKKKFEEQYGKKKGQSVFYAMENSGKLKKVLKAKGGMDASQDDFGSSSSSVGGKGSEGGDGVTAKKGPVQVGGPMKYTMSGAAFNAVSKAMYNQKNLQEQKKIDVLGGEMLTTKKNIQPKTTPGGMIGANQPIIMNKPIDTNLIKPKENFFNFKPFSVGGLSGGVRSGPPPKRGPQPQGMKKGGYKK